MNKKKRNSVPTNPSEYGPPLITFRVGAFDYTVRRSKVPMYDEGDECLGISVQAQRVIYLSPTLRDEDAARVVMREIARVWTFETACPASFEGWLDLAATVGLSAVRDLKDLLIQKLA